MVLPINLLKPVSVVASSRIARAASSASGVGGATGLLRPRPDLALLRVIREETTRVRTRFELRRGALDAEEATRITQALGGIDQRLLYWDRAVEGLDVLLGRERGRYAEDIGIGARLLLDRVTALGVSLFAGPIDRESVAQDGLKTGITVPSPTIHRRGIPEETVGEKVIVSALVNHDVRFGRPLRLRNHQIWALQQLTGFLEMRRSAILGDGIPPLELLRGTVVMPVGGGKTRMMVATFAAAIEQGFYDPHRGDIFVVANHTDRIHGQNLQVVQRLGPFFQRRFGIPLRVSEYKAKRKNVRGHVVIVSIPTVKTPEARAIFMAKLRERLGEKGRIVIYGVDEVHHQEMGGAQESWRELERTLRTLSPRLVRVGFTATPTGREGPNIVTIPELALMRAGVTPRTYLVKVPGIELPQLKKLGGSDFNTQILSSTLLDHPERNEAVFRHFERWAMPRKSKSPSGKERPKGSLFFAADLSHARMMIEGYRRYFEGGEGTFRNRRIHILGLDRGVITHEELREALRRYHSGEVDSLIAIVSGYTPRDIQDRILVGLRKKRNGSSEGEEVEAVFTDRVWLEGADLWGIAHGVGSRATLSRFVKGQERGRLNRRGPDDVTQEGELLFDEPVLLFDVIDRYYSEGNGTLMSYGELMGLLGYARVGMGELLDVMKAPMLVGLDYETVQGGDLFDAMSGTVVDRVDEEGREVVRRDWTELMRGERGIRRRRDQSITNPVVAKLLEVLKDRYEGDVVEMAADLGIAVDEVERLLQGKGFQNARWFYRRLATLLYLDRIDLLDLYNRQRGARGEKITNADMALLQGALTLYRRWEGGEVDNGFVVRGNIGWGEEVVEVARDSVRMLEKRAIQDLSWRRMMQALYLYFSIQAGEEGEHRDESLLMAEELKRQFYRHMGWPEDAETAEEELLSFVREGVFARYAGILPRTAADRVRGLPNQNNQALLSRWIAGEEIADRSKHTAEHTLFQQIRVLLEGLSVNEERERELIVNAVFERREREGWVQEEENVRERVRRKIREEVAWKWGGRILAQPKISGLPKIVYRDAPIRLWFEGKEVEMTKALIAQIRSLVTYFGIDEEIDEKDWLVEKVA